MVIPRISAFSVSVHSQLIHRSVYPPLNAYILINLSILHFVNQYRPSIHPSIHSSIHPSIPPFIYSSIRRTHPNIYPKDNPTNTSHPSILLSACIPHLEPACTPLATSVSPSLLASITRIPRSSCFRISYSLILSGVYIDFCLVIVRRTTVTLLIGSCQNKTPPPASFSLRFDAQSKRRCRN